MVSPMGFLKIFLTSFAIWALVECQSNTTIQIVGHNYTQFDLFKNTGFQPCPPNEIASPKLLARSSDGGAQGGGSTNVSVMQQTVKTETVFCHYLSGTPIMIPTVPTQTAFFPWWPTFTVQFISLSLSYVGLWWTYRIIKNGGETGMALPKSFWVQLGFDVAREIAWFFKTIHGFVDPKRFAWTSVVLWVLPFNYLWLTQQLISNKNETSRRDPPSNTTYFGNKEPATVREQLLHQDAEESEGARTQKKSRLFWASVGIAILTSVHWILTLVSVISHWLYKIGNNQRTRTYYEVPNAVTNPSSIAPGMPPACLDWLKSDNVNASGLLKLDYDQMTVVLITILQFGICTIACVERIRKYFQRRRLNSYKRNFSTLKITAAASLASLGIAALFTGFWILGTVVLKGANVNMRYTNDLNATGGCTFAMVGMNKRWGYWDVEYELAFRIIMSALGAS